MSLAARHIVDRQLRRIPLLDPVAQYYSLKEELDEAMQQVMQSGHYILGPTVTEFEDAVAAYCQTKHAIGVANGTDALLLTLDALGIGTGDEVITTPFTFFASAEVISQVGATPVFVDIQPDSYNLNPKMLEAAITDKTKAIISVHLFGQPADMAEILDIGAKYGIPVIEDACQAIGSAYSGKSAGSMGIAGCFSFFPTKNLGGYGDGGIIVTNDDDLARKLRILRVHGSNPKYYHSMIGYNSRLDALQAAMLLIKLPHLDNWNRRRRELAEAYGKQLRDLPLQLPVELANRYSVYHLYIIQTDRRDELIHYLEQHGIASGVYYPVPLHLQEVYSGLGYGEGSMPEAERASLGTMALPLYPEMSDEDQAFVVQTVRQFFHKKRGASA